jgi:hypothetical protein
MPAWKAILNDDQIDDIAYLKRGLAGSEKSNPGYTAKPCIRTVKPTILAAGQTLNSVPPEGAKQVPEMPRFPRLFPISTIRHTFMV